jgi:hypothetical protein
MSGSSPGARVNGTAAALPETWRKLVAEGVSEGRRNTEVARLTGHLLRQNVDVRVVLALLLPWNKCCCRPPLDDTEIVRTVNSIAMRELRRRGTDDY